jgi:prolyl oligopeptidase
VVAIIHPRTPVRSALTVLGCAALGACAASPGSRESSGEASLRYPPTAQVDHADLYHGTRVADPWRWMEDLDSPAVKAWVEAQNGLAQPWLETIPQRARVLERLKALWDYDQYGYAWLEGKDRVPLRRGDRYFFVEKRGLQDQGVLYWAPSPEAEPRVLIDPNALSSDATVSLSDFVVSPDGRFVAWATSDGGTDWDTWRVREVDSGRDLGDEIRRTKFTRVAWTPDAGAFYYSAYPALPDGRGDDQRQVRVYRHRLGTPQSADELVYEVTDHPRRNPYAELSDDGRWLLLQLTDGFQANAYRVLDLQAPGAGVRPLLDAWDGLHAFLGSAGDLLYFQTTAGAPNGRVIALRAAEPAPERWQVVVPEQPERLEAASLVGGHVVAQYLEDARSRVRVHRLDGTLRNEVALPGSGTAYGFAPDRRGAETFFAYTDYLTPASLYRYDLARDEVSLFRAPRVAFDPGPYVADQVFYESKDGTRVPMTVVRRRDAPRDGSQPLLLYGYGGFDISLTPSFSPAVAAWLDLGGAYAVANLRGGGEYGAAWHEAGTKLAKQNVFDDFIAAAEWLVREGYTSPGRLAIHGRSNGGLLVGAAMTQRPELFAAALPGVGVLDMLRYHTASANAYQWSSDYGTVESAEMFQALHAYSPVHRVQKGACYPATLVTTADRDDRVVPWHSYKFAAALQAAQGCANPALIRIETRAGHGAGKPTWMQIEDWADQWAFLARQLGME